MGRITDPPAGLTRFGLSRGEAAFVAGVSVGTFDKMVEQAIMPRPKVWGSRRIWLRPEIERALFELPEDDAEGVENPWDGAK